MAGFNLLRGLRSIGKRPVTVAVADVTGLQDALDATAASCLYQERLAVSTGGDAITLGGWRQRVLATTVHEGITGASLAAGVITLPAGDYLIEYVSHFETTNIGSPIDVASRIYDATGAAEVTGSGSYALIPPITDFGTAGAAAAESVCIGAVKVSPAVETDYQLETQVSWTGTTGTANPYTSRMTAQVKITKL